METQNSPTDTERSDGGQCSARSAVPNSKDMKFPNSPRGVVKLQQGDGVENQEQGCFCPQTKRKMTSPKCSMHSMRKKLRRRSGNEENDVSGIHTDRPLLSEEPAQDVCSLERTSIAVTRGEGDAITDTGQLYATESLPRISETRVGAPSTDILETLSCNSLVLDYSNPPRTDMDRRFHGCLPSESQNNPYNATPINRMKSPVATFSNSQIPQDPTGGYFCAQNIDDMKLFQILRYIKSCDGGIDLLWNFIHEHAELFPLQYLNVTQDTVDQENRAREENNNLDVKLCRVYGVHPAESQEGQLPRYGDERLEVDYQGLPEVKPHIENCFVRISDNGHELQSAGVNEEISNLHDIESNSTVECSEVEDTMGENNMEGNKKEEISNLHDIESDSTVERNDIEDNQDKDVEDSMDEDNMEREIKEENTNLHEIESDSTAERTDIEDNQDKDVEYMMGENNVEDEMKEENTDLHEIESDSTVEHNDVEDNQDKEVEDSMGENNVEGEMREENTNLHESESESTVERSGVEDNQDKDVEHMMGENNMEGKIKEEISNVHDIETDSTVERSDIEDNQDKDVEYMMGENNVEDEMKEENTDLHEIESDSTVEQSDVEDNPYKKIGDSLDDTNLQAAEVEGKINPHDVESHNNIEVIDAYFSCDSSDNKRGNRSEHECPRKSNCFSSDDAPQFISIFAASNVSISEINDSDGECPLFCKSTTMKPIAIGAGSSASSTHCKGVGCCTNGCLCVDGQYHHRKEDNLTEDGTGKSMRYVVGHSVDKRYGLTGSDVEAEKMSELYAETESSQMEKGDNNPVGQTSSDIMAGHPMSPKADLNNDGEIYLVPGCVQGDVISHLKDQENIFDTARLNTKENETHCGEREGEQKEETGKQGCPVWRILEHLECPFNWVPDICIKRTLDDKIQGNMIDHLTGKPTLMIQFVK